MARLTKKIVEDIACADKEFFVWSDDPKGFGVKVFPSGSKSFVFQYRTLEGRTRRFTIGKLSDALTVEQARKRAGELYREVLNGNDPMEHKQQRRVALTVNQLLDRYLASPTFGKKADSTRYVDKGRIERHLRPLVGSSYADMLTADSVRRVQTAITEGKTAAAIKTKPRGLAQVKGGPGTADKAVLILRAAYSWAISEGILKDNPAAAVKVSQPGQRDTILKDVGDYADLFQTLTKMENEHRIRPTAADAIRFIALTGARLGEVVNLTWQHVDFYSAQIVLPPKKHKTGKRTGKPRIIGLPAEAQTILLKQTEGTPSDYVFRPAKGAGPMSLTKPWQQVRRDAQLPNDLGLHGLRHSLASHLAMNSASAVELMEALGHKQISTTLRYIHFAERARSTLAERGAAMAVSGMTEAESKKNAEGLPQRAATKKTQSK